MSEVFSFRLDDKNPRENEARNILLAWGSKGFNLRQTITEALILLGTKSLEQRENSMTPPDLDELVERLTFLVNKLESGTAFTKTPELQGKPELKNEFIAAVRKNAQQGMKFEA